MGEDDRTHCVNATSLNEWLVFYDENMINFACQGIDWVVDNNG